LNNLLVDLYGNFYPGLLEEAKTLKPSAAFPLLIKVSDQYVNADIKVMIVGQETDEWYGRLNEDEHSIETLMDGYHNYLFKISQNGKARTSRPFWNMKNFEYFESKFKVEGKSVSFIWNNISKIGNHGSGRPAPDIRRLEKSHFNVIKSEVEIVKPDIILFTTGSRDGYIKEHFGKNSKFIPKLYYSDGSLIEKSVNMIAEVKLEHFPEICSVRVEHPNRRSIDNGIVLHILNQCWKSMNTQKS